MPEHSGMRVMRCSSQETPFTTDSATEFHGAIRDAPVLTTGFTQSDHLQPGPMLSRPIIGGPMPVCRRHLFL